MMGPYRDINMNDILVVAFLLILSLRSLWASKLNLEIV